MDVIILAGGLGTRLRSMVSDVPKCMAPVAGHPFLHYLFLYLERFSFVEKVILSLGYKSEAVITWIEQNYNCNFEIVYSIEDVPLGTGGAVKKALIHSLSENVLVLNGDTFFDVDIGFFNNQHIASEALLSIALKPMKSFERYGNVELNDRNIISDFNEKTYCDDGQINGGVYLLRNKQNLFSELPNRFSLETDFLQPAVNKHEVYGFIHDGYFIDIGIPEDYLKANDVLPTLFI